MEPLFSGKVEQTLIASGVCQAPLHLNDAIYYIEQINPKITKEGVIFDRIVIHKYCLKQQAVVKSIDTPFDVDWFSISCLHIKHANNQLYINCNSDVIVTDLDLENVSTFHLDKEMFASEYDVSAIMNDKTVILGDHLFFGQFTSRNSEYVSLFNYDVENHQLIWSIELEDFIRQIVADDSYLYVHIGEEIMCVEQVTGKVQWTFKLSEYDELILTQREQEDARFHTLYKVDDTLCFCVFHTHYVMALDCKTGQPVWHTRLDFSPSNSQAYNPNTGQLHWFSSWDGYAITDRQGEISLSVPQPREDWGDLSVTLTCGAVLIDEYFVSVADNGVFFAMHCESGKLTWTYDAKLKYGTATDQTKPIVYGNNIYILADHRDNRLGYFLHQLKFS